FWVRGNRARTHDGFRCLEGKIDDRREISIETQPPAGFADYFTVFAEEPAVACSEDVGGRRRGTGDVAEPVHPATLHVHAFEQGSRNAGLAVLEQFAGLSSADDVTRKENHTGGLQPGEQGREARRHFRAVETDDQELADRGQISFLRYA